MQPNTQVAPRGFMNDVTPPYADALSSIQARAAAPPADHIHTGLSAAAPVRPRVAPAANGPIPVRQQADEPRPVFAATPETVPQLIPVQAHPEQHQTPDMSKPALQPEPPKAKTNWLVVGLAILVAAGLVYAAYYTYAPR